MTDDRGADWNVRGDVLGHLDGIVSREHDEPKPGPTEIIVQVRAASINRRDLMILDLRASTVTGTSDAIRGSR
jgi:NADPH:quinone reductase-like Zn-dependent oxidoreductase